MPDFQLTKTPIFSPTRCVTCHANRDEGGFIDLLVDEIPLRGFSEATGDPLVPMTETGIGHLYLCATCLKQAAKLVGCLTPDAADKLMVATETLALQRDELEGALAAERENKTLSLSDLRTFMANQPNTTNSVAPVTIKQTST